MRQSHHRTTVIPRHCDGHAKSHKTCQSSTVFCLDSYMHELLSSGRRQGAHEPDQIGWPKRTGRSSSQRDAIEGQVSQLRSFLVVVSRVESRKLHLDKNLACHVHVCQELSHPPNLIQKQCNLSACMYLLDNLLSVHRSQPVSPSPTNLLRVSSFPLSHGSLVSVPPNKWPVQEDTPLHDANAARLEPL